MMRMPHPEPSWRIGGILLAVVFAGLAVGVSADPLDLRDVEVRDYIARVAAATGRSFVLDPRVRGRVTLVGKEPAGPEEIYKTFVSVMRVEGYSLIDSGGIIKIVPDAVAKSLAGEEAGLMYAGEGIVTRTFKIEHVLALELSVILKPLVSAEAHLAASIGTNTITLADTAANVVRIGDLIAALDRPVERGYETISLHNADPVFLASFLNSALPRFADTNVTPPPAATADVRTNSLVINGTRDELLQMRAWIADLDTPVGTSRDSAVIFLKHANAVDLVDTLQQVADQLMRHRSTRIAAVPTGHVTVGPVEAEPTSDDGFGASPDEVAGSSVSAAARPLRVVAEPATNALILQGSAADMAALRRIIDTLDIPRAQVYVEAIVAEVSATRTAELGIQWRTGNPADGAIAGSILPGAQSGDLQALSGTSPILGSGLSLGHVEGGTMRALLRALAADGSTNVLSTPTLMTMDNEEAELQVGQNVPILIGQYTTTGSGDGVSNPFQTVERRDVGVQLKVKPQISQGDLVRLTVEQELSAVAPSSVAADIVLDRRAIKTDVNVQDGQIIVIGGLAGEDVRQSTQMVPVAGDIPLIGNAARDRRSDLADTNLLVFLGVTVVRDSDQVVDLTERGTAGLRSDGTRRPRVQLLPEEALPRLP